ncbi:MAG: protein translocase subunit SecF [Patescibacteria group bacterium]
MMMQNKESRNQIRNSKIENLNSNHYLFLGRKKKLWFTISLGLFIVGILFLIIWKLPFGIDFKGGAQMDLSFDKPVGETDLRQKVSEYPDVEGLVVTKTDQSALTLRMLPITNEQHQAIIKKINEDFGSVTEKQYQLVGPSVSQDLTRKAILAVVLASVFIILYLAYSFRTVTFPVSSWRFGVVAVVALLHDLVITVGVFSILAHFFHFEVDASFITALLTVMGFSVHDTIVVFDRIRENLAKHKEESLGFETIADMSLSQTLNRSMATSLTVIFTLTALTVMGGESIRGFVVTLLIGIVIGTYSSIFTATPLLVVWQNRINHHGKHI